MKYKLLTCVLLSFLCLSMTSCYNVSYAVGEGSKTGEIVKKKNHYIIYGLAPLKTSNPIKMAGDAANYDVTIKHSFFDGLLSLVTYGIYTPTTTIVIK